MLAVDGQKFGAAIPNRCHEERAAHDQRLLVREQESLARPGSGDSGSETRCTDDGRHHGVGSRIGGDLFEPLLSLVTVFRSTGSESVVELLWWKRWFLLLLISGTLTVVGLLLRRTSWENRISMVLLSAFAAVLLSLRRDSGVSDAVALAVPGAGLVLILWLLSLVLGRRQPVAVTVPLSIPAPVVTAAGDEASSATQAAATQTAAGSDEGGAA